MKSEDAVRLEIKILKYNDVECPEFASEYFVFELILSNQNIQCKTLKVNGLSHAVLTVDGNTAVAFLQ